MITKKEIDQMYLGLASTLEMDYFKIVLEKVDGKVVGQHRELRSGKTQAAFDADHKAIWQSHEAELIANGYLDPHPPHIPARDLAAELDELKGKVAALEKK